MKLKIIAVSLCLLMLFSSAVASAQEKLPAFPPAQEKEFQEIDFIIFDESKNRYLIEFYEKDSTASSAKHDVKIKVKWLKQKRKDYGKISIKLRK